MWLMRSLAIAASVPYSFFMRDYLIFRSLSPSFTFIFLASFYYSGLGTYRLRNLPLRVGLL